MRYHPGQQVHWIQARKAWEDHETWIAGAVIHKSQGSQFDEVAVVLPGERSRLLTRELFYAAVTRAQRKVWLVSGEDVVRHAIGRSVQRASGLRSRLWGE